MTEIFLISLRCIMYHPMYAAASTANVTSKCPNGIDNTGGCCTGVSVYAAKSGLGKTAPRITSCSTIIIKCMCDP
ncbi:MAG: hypothetical protein WAM14_06015 [Candidatus Nitrosopolaris sp.]